MGIILAYLIGQTVYLIKRKVFNKHNTASDMEKGNTPSAGHSLASTITNSGPISIFAYCLSSILMTVTNKFVVSGFNFNLNFLLLAVQSIVCIFTIGTLKHLVLLPIDNSIKTKLRNGHLLHFY